ncbi:eukaryotic translation initiation factor 4 gamma 2 isoform X1 [Frankliniella occidentalis]|uniref:Eukaryotic translation initiation factor 4 gamma 2 n=2 Tax=Frankliniella occidentalis TaxID=133901 RepID=A0A6J1SX80_FRAOC|nr:eukaryotic translation initiation factor 4 gamma 2 isoform X1 [Frankliniella occidentalis]XP_052129720.1 eukaryotic translation initiation factor 4 gamma 2 isoform X1 [Frankliniella occidentalis]
MDDTRSLITKRRWIPPSTIRRDDALTQETKNDLLFRKVRGILNKLTPEKFQKLSDDLLAIQLDTSTILKGVILLIFEKALDEPKYSSMYAQLCKRLTEEAPNFEPEGKPCTFRLLLLNKCRSEFENRAQATKFYERNDGIPLTTDEEEKRQLAKRKMLGNIKFIGELGKLGILAERVLHQCIQQLLLDSKKKIITEAAEDLECLSQIMCTCGRLLDYDMARGLMDQYFTRMKVLAENSELPRRIRFMLRDVIELRANNWVPRKATTVEGPMPMHQIRDDSDPPARSYTPPSRGGDGVGRSGGGGGLVSSLGMTDYFRPPNKIRPGGFDEIGYGYPSVGGPNQSHISQRYGNGYSGRDGGRDGHHNNNRGNFRGQNFQNHGKNYNHHNNHHNFNNNSVKELGPRLKKLMNDADNTNIEEVQLRPSANSMLFKQTQTKQPMLNTRSSGVLGPPPGRGVNLLNEPISNPPKAHAPLLHKEQPILIKQASQDKNKNARKDKGPNKEEVLKKVQTMMEEYMKNASVDEALSAYREHKIPDKFVTAVLHTILNHALDKSDKERDQVLNFVAALRKENLMTLHQFHDSVKEVVSQMSDKEQEIPKIFSHVANYAARSIILELMTLSDVAELTEGGSYYPLFMLTLQILNKEMGKAEITKLFNDSKINLMSTLPDVDRTKERMSEILEERGLTFLFPLLRIQSALWKQIQADPVPTQFYKWIKETLDPAHQTDSGFINALMTVLLKYISQESTLGEGSDPNLVPDKALQEKEKALLEKYKLVLKAFLHNHLDLQVTAVYSLQVFCYSNNFPKGMLLRWFVNLYDLEVIEEEAFFKWKEDISDDYPGKGKALFQVNQWLMWLAEAESEEEEDGDA